MFSCRKILIIIPLILLCFGCSKDTKGENPDYTVAAIVNGEEITVKDLRMLYYDEQALDRLDATIKATLVMQETERLGLDISEDVAEDIEMRQSLLTDDPENEALKANREFAESQAGKFNMEVKDYYEEYVTITAKINASMARYVYEKLGPLEEETDESIEEYNEKANHLLNELVKKYEDEIEILIKKTDKKG